ncbi:AfsR/SARP family transcriptional regulator [Streptomyces sp. NPDC054796]
MHFRILGPLEISDSRGKLLSVSQPKQRQLLATLLLEANRDVPLASLVECLWDEKPPRSAISLIRTYIWRLRRLLCAHEPGAELLHTAGDGYRIVVTFGQLDAEDFRGLSRQGRVAAGRGDPAASKLLERALTSWRGGVLQDVPLSLPLRAAVEELQEERQTTFESWVDVSLALGRHQELLPALRRETARFPLRERPWGQLMLALFRSGRKADALEIFQRLRHGLVAQLGLEPCWQLQELHRLIIADDQVLSTRPLTAFEGLATGPR